MNAKSIPAILAAMAAIALAGCAYPGRGSADYRGYQTGTEQSVRFGVVESVRPVRIDPANTGVGSVTGATLGGIAGSTVGGGSGSVAAAIAGAVAGGIIGYNIEKDANAGMGIEIMVRLDDGRYIAVVQEADEDFRAGDRVRILSGQGTTRIAH